MSVDYEIDSLIGKLSVGELELLVISQSQHSLTPAHMQKENEIVQKKVCSSVAAADFFFLTLIQRN